MAEDLAFHFSAAQPDQQLFSDIQTLNAFGLEQLEKFSELALDSLQDQQQQPSDVLEALRSFGAEHGMNSKALGRPHQGLVQLFGEALRHNLSLGQLQSDLMGLGLEAARSTLLANHWQSRFFLLSQAQIDNTVKANELVDLEWKFGVTAASNQLQQSGAVFLQLKLSLKRNNRIEKVLMELSLPQFYKFLQQMRAAQAQLNRI